MILRLLATLLVFSTTASACSVLLDDPAGDTAPWPERYDLVSSRFALTNDTIHWSWTIAGLEPTPDSVQFLGQFQLAGMPSTTHMHPICYLGSENAVTNDGPQCQLSKSSLENGNVVFRKMVDLDGTLTGQTISVQFPFEVIGDFPFRTAGDLRSATQLAIGNADQFNGDMPGTWGTVTPLVVDEALAAGPFDCGMAPSYVPHEDPGPVRNAAPGTPTVWLLLMLAIISAVASNRHRFG